MRIERLRLTDFRNYQELDLLLPPGLIVFYGRNAQGKSNLLEAVTLFATSRSFRTSSEREAVRWGALGHFARIEAHIQRHEGPIQIEVILTDSDAEAATQARPVETPAPALRMGKRIRVNGVPRRAMDLLGLAPVVVFAPTDLDLVIGSPSERRRFLDLTLCQVDNTYCRTLSQYQKVLTQRAALLRRIRDGEDTPQALGYWDDLLTRLAAPIMRIRASFIERAGQAAARVYAALTHDEPDELDDPDAAVASGVPREPLFDDDPMNMALRLVYRPSYGGAMAGDEKTLAEEMRARLGELRRREIAQGVNVLGPHRDDLAFLAGEIDLATYGSRGQQRTVALALKLAELAYIEAAIGDQPILLLDDVLSELDVQRRADLLSAVRGLDQVLLTTADTDSLPAEALAQAHRYRVRAGQVIPM
ncbi:MAG TPA: DNA replication/repair protein RecF [Ktedonobacterales bacterium]|nr:DNA replication/repair protein RecF [Ktedonobacterales bacterium]